MEEYRRMAATLHKMQAERAIKTLMVTSACPREGKTLTVTNLAFTLSESYRRRVLLIDGDLRRPSIHQILRLPNTSGLGDALRSDRAPLAFIEVSPTLTVLPVGQVDPDSVAGLASNRMKTVIDEAAARFDWVLVDTPPIGLLSDARFIAGFVDGVLLVISVGQTPYLLVQRTITELGPERIIGTVLNRFKGRTSGSNQSYEDYYVTDGAKHG
jgi:capsular exopolysaccharide synthesis family protein